MPAAACVACPRAIMRSWLRDTASEAAKLLSKPTAGQIAGSSRGKYRTLSVSAGYRSDRINNSRFFENSSAAAIWVYMQAISAFKQQCRNPLDCEPAWVAMAEFNLNLGGGIPWRQGKI